MNLETGSNAPSSELIQGLAVGKASIPKNIYAALRISRDKNKVAILDVYWDCGFLGVKDGIILLRISTVHRRLLKKLLTVL